MTGANRTRDAARSRDAILTAAAARFATHGYTDASLADIGTAAGLSRGAPGYFFGSKDALYAAVIESLFAERETAMRPAFAPLSAWPHTSTPEPLADVLRDAVGAYLAFLHARPQFVALVEREALAGGARLAAAPHRSTAMEDAFA